MPNSIVFKKGGTFMSILSNSTRRPFLLCLTVGLAVGIVLAVTLGFNLVNKARADDQLLSINDPLAIARITEKLAPAVVSIETVMKSDVKGKNPFDTPEFRRFFGFPDEPQEQESSKGFGSGFIVDERGFIITNYHVVQNAEAIEVKLLGGKKSYPAEFLDGDPEIDIAILKIKADQKLTVAPIGSSDATKVGEWVVAIGNPLGMSHTVTVGVVSAKGRQVPITNGRRAQIYDNLLQTDAAINPGNSGGPLINLKGQVIGINSAVSATGQNIGFAQPIDVAKDLIQDVIEHGKSQRAWLGVLVIGVTELDDDTRSYFNLSSDTSGLLVTDVVPNSPAMSAGIQQYDIVLEYNKTQLKTGKDLVNLVRKSKPGDNISLLVNRNGRILAIKAKLVEKPKP
jgi:serine protease Do